MFRMLLWLLFCCLPSCNVKSSHLRRCFREDRCTGRLIRAEQRMAKRTSTSLNPNFARRLPSTNAGDVGWCYGFRIISLRSLFEISLYKHTSVWTSTAYVYTYISGKWLRVYLSRQQCVLSIVTAVSV